MSAYGPDAGTERTGLLTVAQRDRLHALLADPSFGSAYHPGPCRDAFRYSLQAGRVRLAYDECGASPARAAAEIVALLAGATPFKAWPPFLGLAARLGCRAGAIAPCRG
jgi:hypothetical protein